MPNKRKCKACGEYKIERGSNPIIKWCSEKCKEIVIQDTFKQMAKQRERTLNRKAEKERKFNAQRKRMFYAKDIKTRREAAVYWFNRYIRLRDAGNGCISCGTTNPNIKYDAGHFIPAGSCSALRFDERNVHLQCSVQCNQHKSGNRAEYRKRLIQQFGAETVEFLEGPQPTIKITAQWYKDTENEYKAKCKQLEQRAA